MKKYEFISILITFEYNKSCFKFKLCAPIKGLCLRILCSPYTVYSRFELIIIVCVLCIKEFLTYVAVVLKTYHQPHCYTQVLQFLVLSSLVDKAIKVNIRFLCMLQKLPFTVSVSNILLFFFILVFFYFIFHM